MGAFVEEMGRYVEKSERKGGDDGDMDGGHVGAAGVADGVVTAAKPPERRLGVDRSEVWATGCGRRGGDRGVVTTGW